MDMLSKSAADAKETEYLELLRDEGLRLVAAFRKIESREDREIIIRLTESLARKTDSFDPRR